MQTEINALKSQFEEKLAQVNSNLDNIANDIAGLNTKVADLNAKVQAGTPLTEEDKAVLAEIAAGMSGLVDKTTVLAAVTPE